MASKPPTLTEDEIDEILYLARTNEAAELTTYLTQLATTHARTPIAILSAAIDPESKNTALHYIAANGHLDLLTYLPTLPPSALNAPNSSANTPLHWAALNGHLALVQYLVRAGADAALTNAAGHDCVFEAELNGKTEVVEWLLREAVGLESGIAGEQGGEGPAEEEDQDEMVGEGEGEEEVRTGLEGLNVGGKGGQG